MVSPNQNGLYTLPNPPPLDTTEFGIFTIEAADCCCVGGGAPTATGCCCWGIKLGADPSADRGTPGIDGEEPSDDDCDKGGSLGSVGQRAV